MCNDNRIPATLEYWKDKKVCKKCKMICEKVSFGPMPNHKDGYIKYNVCPKCKDIIDSPFRDSEHTLIQNMMHTLLEK